MIEYEIEELRLNWANVPPGTFSNILPPQSPLTLEKVKRTFEAVLGPLPKSEPEPVPQEPAPDWIPASVLAALRELAATSPIVGRYAFGDRRTCTCSACTAPAPEAPARSAWLAKVEAIGFKVRHIRDYTIAVHEQLELVFKVQYTPDRRPPPVFALPTITLRTWEAGQYAFVVQPLIDASDEARYAAWEESRRVFPNIGDRIAAFGDDNHAGNIGKWKGQIYALDW